MALCKKDAIARLKAGAVINVTLPSPLKPSEKLALTLSGGGVVSRATFESLRAALRPVSPGIFADSEPLQWAWRDDASAGQYTEGG